jgi:hypothetical protein
LDTPHGEHRQSPGCGSPACAMEGMPRGGEPQEPPGRLARRGESIPPPCRRSGAPSLQTLETLEAACDASVGIRTPLAVRISRARGSGSRSLSHEKNCPHGCRWGGCGCKNWHGPETLTFKVNPDNIMKKINRCLRGSQPHVSIKTYIGRCTWAASPIVSRKGRQQVLFSSTCFTASQESLSRKSTVLQG